MRRLTAVLEMFQTTMVRPDAPTRDKLKAMGAAVPGKSVALAAILRQPDMCIQDLAPLCPGLSVYSGEVLAEAETRLKYQGYLMRQQESADRLERMEVLELPRQIDYGQVAGLSKEVVEKLSALRPRNLGQASRISGVTPASLACLEIHLKKLGRC
jgi:tRNA uridine 5-carboxymethylaminomethyl modification enzyme